MKTVTVILIALLIITLNTGILIVVHKLKKKHGTDFSCYTVKKCMSCSMTVSITADRCPRCNTGLFIYERKEMTDRK